MNLFKNNYLIKIFCNKNLFFITSINIKKMNTSSEIVYSSLKIYKPKPKRYKYISSNNNLKFNPSIEKCPFDISKDCYINNSSSKTNEELYINSCSIEEIEKDFALLKQRKQEKNIQNDYFFSNSNCSTRPNSSEEESNINIYVEKKKKNPFYKNFE